MISNFRKTVSVVASWMLLASTSLVYGQIRSATINGSVLDSTGSAVPGAEVSITNQDTNISAKLKASDSGQFVFPYLPAGVYTVSISAPGFVSFKESGVRLDTSQTARVDAVLKVSNVETTVEVQAAAARIQTESTSVTGAIQANVIDAIPNITQNPLYYAFLQAGVQPRGYAYSTTNDNSFGIGLEARKQFSSVGINGGRAFTNDIQLDGLPVMGGGHNEAAVIPNTEGLQEVRVISNTFSAEYGRGQGIIQMSTKSGSNAFHGQGTYTIRNEALNANTNSNKANGLPRGVFKSHEIGGALTGPIIRNRLFFSSSLHYLRFNSGSTPLNTVPTALEKVGDFSKTLIRETTGLPVPAVVFDPYNVVQLGPDFFQRLPYPNAVVANNPAFSAAVYMNTFYPTPNRTPDDVYNTNNYISTVVKAIRSRRFNNRVDYKLGNQSIYFSGGFGSGQIVTPRPFGTSPFNGAPDITSDSNPYGQIGDTIVLTPTLILDFRYGVTRIRSGFLSGDKTGFTDYDKIGVPKNLQSFIQLYGSAPTVAACAGGCAGSGGGSNWSQLAPSNFGNKAERQTSHSLNGSMTKINGRWTHKFGGEFRNLLSNYSDLEEGSVSMPAQSNSGSVGNFTFEYLNALGTSVTQNVSNAQKGVNGAMYFTGAGLWYIRPGANLKVAYAQPYAALYSQNDWRVNSKLTVNLGLRWEVQPGPSERYNRVSAFDLNKKNPFGSQGTIAFPGQDGYSRTLWDNEYNDWGPRVGVAYQAIPGLVFRGGFGITYLPTNTGDFSGPNEYGSTPFGGGTNFLPYGTNPQGVPVGRFTDPTPIALPAGSDLKSPAIWGNTDSRFLRNQKNGVAKQWNFFIEKALTKTWFASVGYSASKSTNLQNRFAQIQTLQDVPASVLATWRTQYIASNGVTNPANVLVPNPLQPANGPLIPYLNTLGQATVPQSFLYMPYPYLYRGLADDFYGYADYNSLQLRLSHAFSSGFQMDLNYIWSKELDYTATGLEDAAGINVGGRNVGIDYKNLRNNRRYGSADVPNRVTAVLVYELPFGPNKPFAPSNKLVSNIIGGWQLGSVITMQGGQPIIISGASDGALLAHPNRVAGVPLEVPKELQRWYDGVTSVTLPCGRIITPTKNTFLKYNACAFQGQTVLAPNGKYIPDQYWIGASHRNPAIFFDRSFPSTPIQFRPLLPLMGISIILSANEHLKNLLYSPAHRRHLRWVN